LWPPFSYYSAFTEYIHMLTYHFDFWPASSYVHVNVEYFEHKSWTYDFLVYFVRFIDTDFRKFDQHKPVLSADVVWNVLLLCRRILHSTVARKQIRGRKFLHQVLSHSLAKLCTENYENPSIFVKVTVKKSLAPIVYGHSVLFTKRKVHTEGGDVEWHWTVQWPLLCIISPKAMALAANW